MNLERKILDLKNQRKAAIDEASAFLDSKDIDKYNAKMAEVEGFNAEIEACEKLLAEQKRHPAGQPIDIQSNGGNDDDDITISKVDKIRTGKEYLNAFINAIIYGANVKRDAFNPDYAVLYNALTATKTGEDGGFLVPIDIDNSINEFKRQFLDLSVYFNNETVTTLSGWRVVDSAPENGFAEIDELDTIPEDDQPKFAKLAYLVRKYGMILPISNELLDDNAANLTAYIARWFAKKEILTKNKILIALLKLLTATNVTAGEEIDAIKTAVNETLDPEIAANAKVITNQSGYKTLDLLKDTTGKPLLQPDVTVPTKKVLGGKEIIVVSNKHLKNTENKAPLFIGDYMQYGTLFTRKPFEMASTNVGAGAFETDSTKVRGIVRLDAKVFDDEAAAYLTLPVGEPEGEPKEP